MSDEKVRTPGDCGKPLASLGDEGPFRSPRLSCRRGIDVEIVDRELEAAMNFLQYEIDANPEDVVEVALDRVANVRLLDPSNFERFRRARPHRYLGGRVDRSPMCLRAPYEGHWFVVIEVEDPLAPAHASVHVRSAA